MGLLARRSSREYPASQPHEPVSSPDGSFPDGNDPPRGQPGRERHVGERASLVESLTEDEAESSLRVRWRLVSRSRTAELHSLADSATTSSALTRSNRCGDPDRCQLSPWPFRSAWPPRMAGIQPILSPKIGSRHFGMSSAEASNDSSRPVRRVLRGSVSAVCGRLHVGSSKSVVCTARRRAQP